MELKKSLLTIDDADNLHLCFELDDKIYAMNAKNVLEITALPMINDPQRLPEFIVGILNYNDMFINIADIRKILSLPKKNYELSNKVIIIKGDESLFAIIVDEITDFFTAVPAQIQRVMGENVNNIVRTFYKIDDNVVNIISIDQLEAVIKKAQFNENTTNYSELFPKDENSLCVLQKRAHDIAKLPEMNLETDIYGKDQYIILKLQNHTYCIYSLFVKELVSPKNYPITKIPYTPNYIRGIINLKGNFYTVLDLKDFIALAPPKDEENNHEIKDQDKKIIVIESSELKLAFLVDDILDIINISKEAIEQKNDMALDNLYIKAEAYIDKKVYNILNVDKIINDKRLYIDNN